MYSLWASVKRKYFYDYASQLTQEKNLRRFFFRSTSSNKKMALRRDFFLSLKELIDLTKSVVPDVKDPFKQQGEALANFF